MMDIFESLIALVASNRSGRGPARLCSPSVMSSALEVLTRARRVAVVTGFFVPSAGFPETDGPGGSAALARAVDLSGREASLWTDERCFSVVASASRAIDGVVPRAASEGSDILSWKPDLIVYLERLGRAADGGYYNMRGQDVSSMVVSLDDAVLTKREEVDVIGIGDGGNEAGMGNLRRELGKLMPSFSRFLSVVESDAPLPVDVSDWGGYALAGALSLSCGEWCGVDPDEVASMVEAEVAAGAVDGVTLKGEPSVDGFPLEIQRSVAAGVRDIVESQLLSPVP
ncbi:conserved hypothetical protein [Dethiosulfovibrio peptidovorans DSM 11002]|uniref:D-glutamate cyclase-like C-terminal domain-containing protein n=1 Tax=Dethiosulfovibrio peptidovorans DSM 11002 TaxID=469381 RepID=D2Z334_9BACT|nr:glutamate cyclase domain-containing protein [Dethiosulfovibrio peptidovorans]EFC90252.1 conserved hypothetical protein [Dethiosulfovibrio peptidovorans DSM 11002]